MRRCPRARSQSLVGARGPRGADVMAGIFYIRGAAQQLGTGACLRFCRAPTSHLYSINKGRGPLPRRGQKRPPSKSRCQEVRGVKSGQFGLPAAGGRRHGGWGSHIGDFSARYPVTAIDMPGAGTRASEKPLSSIPECAAYAEGHISALGLKDVVLMGYSMGGLIGQALAIRNPNVYRGLVLVATASRIKILQEVLDALQNDPVEARKLIDKFARKPGAESKRENASSPETMHAYLKATTDYDAREKAPSITTPTLVLHGDEDLTCPLKFGEWLHENIAGSQFRVFKGAGHMLPEEFAGEMQEAVFGFIDGLT